MLGWRCRCGHLTTNHCGLLGKEGDVFGDEGVIERVEVESGGDLFMAVGKRRRGW